MKAKITSTSIVDGTLIVRIAKNGRPVSDVTALSVLREAYPTVSPEVWKLYHRSGHHTVAKKSV